MGLYCQDTVFTKVYSSSDTFTDTLLLPVYTTPQLSIVLLSSVFVTLQLLIVLLWFVYVSLQSVIDQLSSLQFVVDQQF
jgi:hypothetical protein